MINKICIDPGHGSQDFGATNDKVNPTIFEKTLNLNLSALLALKLKSLIPNIEIVFTRTTDIFIPLNERCRIQKDNKCELFISVHHNGSDNKNAKGFELIYAKGSKRGKLVAEIIHKEMLPLGMFGIKDRGFYEDTRGLAVLNGTSCVSIIIEPFFITNTLESEWGSKPTNQQILAELIAKGIVEVIKQGV